MPPVAINLKSGSALLEPKVKGESGRTEETDVYLDGTITGADVVLVTKDFVRCPRQTVQIASFIRNYDGTDEWNTCIGDVSSVTFKFKFHQVYKRLIYILRVTRNLFFLEL